MYHTKNSQGKETLETEVKLTHVKKNSLSNSDNFFQKAISDSTLNVVLKKSRLKPTLFARPLVLQLD